MTRVGRLALRRSIGRLGLPALLVLVGLHIFGRNRPWVNEWLWAAYQYHFATVLLGPAAAGLAAWEGFRLRRTEDLLEATGRASRALVLSWAALFAWTLVAFGAGLLVVGVLVKTAGTPALPDLPVVASVAPPLALLAAQTASSFAIGWRVRSPIAAPGAALGWFLVTLTLYIVGPETAIRVGGASSSLVGLRPRPEVQASQVLFYVGLAAASLISMRLGRQELSDWRASARLAAWVIPAIAFLALWVQGPNVLERTSAQLECFGENPALCVAPGYVDRVSDVRDGLRPYLAALESIDVDVPKRFEQGAEPGEGAAPLPIEIFLRPSSHEVPRSTVLSWYEAPGCDVGGDLRLVEAFVGLDYWLEAQATGRRPQDPTLPPVLISGSSEEQADWARGALAALRTCGKT